MIIKQNYCTMPYLVKTIVPMSNFVATSWKLFLWRL